MSGVAMSWNSYNVEGVGGIGSEVELVHAGGLLKSWTFWIA